MNLSEIAALTQKYGDLLDSLLESKMLKFSSEDFRSVLPSHGGVYLISEKINNALERVYIGQSKNIQTRIYRNHLRGSRRVSTLKRKMIRTGMFPNEDEVENYLREKCMIQFLIIDDKFDRNSFEHFVIAVLRPNFND